MGNRLCKRCYRSDHDDQPDFVRGRKYELVSAAPYQRGESVLEQYYNGSRPPFSSKCEHADQQNVCGEYQIMFGEHRTDLNKQSVAASDSVDETDSSTTVRQFSHRITFAPDASNLQTGDEIIGVNDEPVHTCSHIQLLKTLDGIDQKHDTTTATLKLTIKRRGKEDFIYLDIVLTFRLSGDGMVMKVEACVMESSAPDQFIKLTSVPIRIESGHEFVRVSKDGSHFYMGKKPYRFIQTKYRLRTLREGLPDYKDFVMLQPRRLRKKNIYMFYKGKKQNVKLKPINKEVTSPNDKRLFVLHEDGNNILLEPCRDQGFFLHKTTNPARKQVFDVSECKYPKKPFDELKNESFQTFPAERGPIRQDGKPAADFVDGDTSSDDEDG